MESYNSWPTPHPSSPLPVTTLARASSQGNMWGKNGRCRRAESNRRDGTSSQGPSAFQRLRHTTVVPRTGRYHGAVELTVRQRPGKERKEQGDGWDVLLAWWDRWRATIRDLAL